LPNHEVRKEDSISSIGKGEKKRANEKRKKERKYLSQKNKEIFTFVPLPQTFSLRGRRVQKKWGQTISDGCKGAKIMMGQKGYS